MSINNFYNSYDFKEDVEYYRILSILSPKFKSFNKEYLDFAYNIYKNKVKMIEENK